MEMVGNRRGEMLEMTTRGEFTLARFVIPVAWADRNANQAAQCDSGHGRLLIIASWNSVRWKARLLPASNGVMISMVPGNAVGFGLFGLQQRAEMFVSPGDDVYEGMIVGGKCAVQ